MYEYNKARFRSRSIKDEREMVGRFLLQLHGSGPDGVPHTRVESRLKVAETEKTDNLLDMFGFRLDFQAETSGSLKI